MGKSTGSVANATTEDSAGDVQAGIEFLRKRKDVDSKPIGLIGHREGGLIAPMVATRSRHVAFVVLLAAPGLPGEQVLYLQSAALRRACGAGDDQISRERLANQRLYGALRQGADSAAVARAVSDLLAEQTAQLSEQQRKAMGDADAIVGAQVGQLLSPWFRFFIAYDPAPTLRELKCSVLALNGEKDLQVLAKENLRAVEDALRAGRNKDYTVKELPGLNHLLQTAETGSVTEYAKIEETVAPAALEAMASWMEARTRPKR